MVKANLKDDCDELFAMFKDGDESSIDITPPHIRHLETLGGETRFTNLTGWKLFFARCGDAFSALMIGPMLRCILYVFDCHHAGACDLQLDMLLRFEENRRSIFY